MILSTIRLQFEKKSIPLNQVITFRSLEVYFALHVIHFNSVLINGNGRFTNRWYPDVSEGSDQ